MKNKIKTHKLFGVDPEDAIILKGKIQELVLKGHTFSEIAEILNMKGKSQYLAYELGVTMALNNVKIDTMKNLKNLDQSTMVDSLRKFLGVGDKNV